MVGEDKHPSNHPPFLVSSAARRCTPEERTANRVKVSSPKPAMKLL